MPGVTSTLFTRDGLLEKNRSNTISVSSVSLVAGWVTKGGAGATE